MTFNLFLAYISVSSGFIPAIVGLFFLKRLFDVRYTRVLLLFFIIISVADLLFSIILPKYRIINNNWIWIHAVNIIEVICYGFVFYEVLHNQWIKKVLPYAVVVLILFMLIEITRTDGWMKAWGVTERAACTTFLIILPLLYFYEIFVQKELLDLRKQVLFWISAGMLFYFAGTFLVTTFISILYVNRNDFPVWSIHSLLNIIANVLYGIGMSCKPRTKTFFS
ncbi:MAG: hypothetical protein H7Y04_08965 [Verrucomicrobia bacterium]|nr:hypothetical protein [Cytophagales bacterium]